MGLRERGNSGKGAGLEDEPGNNVLVLKCSRDPSTTRPDAPKGGAEEKIGPLRSG
jgi:hypothetical protein